MTDNPMRPSTHMETALKRWCREYDMIPGTLVRSAFQGGWDAGMLHDPIQHMDEEVLVGLVVILTNGSADPEVVRTQIRRSRALTTDQGEKEQADG